MSARLWSNAYAYVSRSPCSSCPTFKLNYRPKLYLMIRPEGERRLADDLQSMLSGKGIVVLDVKIADHDTGWMTVIETRQSIKISDDELIAALQLSFEDLDIEDVRDSHVVHAENRSIVSFHFYL